jgi:hypothetical protein
VNFPAPHELTAHQPPALLVAELLAVMGSEDGGSTRLTNTHGLDLLQLIEGCAQSLAVILGQGLRASGGPAASGMLVGVKQAILIQPVLAGIELRVEAKLEHRLPPFRLYAVQVVSGDGVVHMTAELKTMSTDVGDSP